MRTWVALMGLYSVEELIPLFFEVILLFPYDFLRLLFFFFAEVVHVVFLYGVNPILTVAISFFDMNMGWFGVFVAVKKKRKPSLRNIVGIQSVFS